MIIARFSLGDVREKGERLEGLAPYDACRWRDLRAYHILIGGRRPPKARNLLSLSAGEAWLPTAPVADAICTTILDYRSTSPIRKRPFPWDR